jgi:hypothetical protein
LFFHISHGFLESVICDAFPLHVTDRRSLIAGVERFHKSDFNASSLDHVMDWTGRSSFRFSAPSRSFKVPGRRETLASLRIAQAAPLLRVRVQSRGERGRSPERAAFTAFLFTWPVIPSLSPLVGPLVERPPSLALRREKSRRRKHVRKVHSFALDHKWERGDGLGREAGWSTSAIDHVSPISSQNSIRKASCASWTWLPI